MRRRGLVVGEVDGDLRPLVLVHVPADRLAVGKLPRPVDLLPRQRMRRIDVVQAQEVLQVVAVRLAAVADRLGERPADEVAVPAGVGVLPVGEDPSLGIIGRWRRGTRHAALLAQLEGDVGRQRLVAGVEGDVVGDQELAGADDGGPGLRVEPGRAEIRRPVGVAELFGQPLVLAAPNGCQVLSLGPARRRFVEVHGDLEFAADPLADRPRDRGAIVHRHAGDRDERADVGGAHPRVGAVVLAHVEDLRCLGDGLERPLGHGVWVPHEGDHRAVGVRPRVHVEQAHPRDGLDGVRDLLDLGSVPPFGEIRNALDDALIHPRTPSVSAKGFRRACAHPAASGSMTQGVGGCQGKGRIAGAVVLMTRRASAEPGDGPDSGPRSRAPHRSVPGRAACEPDAHPTAAIRRRATRPGWRVGPWRC